MSNELIEFVLVSIALLGIGIYGLAVKRNAIRMEVAVGLALIIVAYRMYKNIDIADFRSLKG